MAKLKINGAVKDVAVEPQWTLAYVLREKLGLTGTKLVCGNGECGNCTVLIDGKPMLSCLMLAVECEDKNIMTIEGVAKEGKLHPIQEAFLENHAVACGYCTPAQVLCAYALLNNNPDPTEAEVKRAISGVICRCTAYVPIIKAILAAAEIMRKQKGA